MHRDLLNAEPARDVVVVDSEEDVDAWPWTNGALVTTWTGRRVDWSRADWTLLAGRTVTVLAAGTDASRLRAEGIAAAISEHGAIVRLCRPDIAGGLAKWAKELDAPALGELLKRWTDDDPVQVKTPKPAAKQKPAAVQAQDWATSKERFEVMGHKAGVVYLRQRDEIVAIPMERLASKPTLIRLAPPTWWTGKTGEEKLSVDLCLAIASAIIETSRNRGLMDEWDLDGDLCGIPGDRVLELVTGRARERMPEDRVSKSLAVAPVQGEPSLWLDALRSLLSHLPDTDEVIEYLRRWFGVSLTTDCSAERFLAFIGPMGSGKGTIAETWDKIAGDYAGALPGSFVAGTGQSAVRHHIAELRGARLVTVGELPDNGRFAATEDLNRLVSGEKLKADQKHRDSETFIPVAHLIVVGNSTPRLSARSGLFRRMLLIRTHTRPRAERDPRVRQRIQSDPAELGRILEWALSGLRDGGLIDHPEPGSLTRAVAEYQENEDALGRFIEDRCVVDDNALEPFDALFREFTKWQDTSEMRHWTKAALAAAFNDDGRFLAFKSHGQARRSGIKLNVIG